MFRERPKGGYTLVGTWEFAEYSFVSTTMDNSVLTYIVNHVFMPPVLPQEDDRDISNDAALCHAVLDCARRYQLHLLDDGHKLQKLDVIIKMLQNFEATLSDTFGSAEVYKQLSSMEIGGKSDIFFLGVTVPTQCF